jgi:murein DD-endopeptidase MepM/ murein hydrolase activator NlpD
MNIIFLSRKHGRPRTLQLPPRALLLAAAAVMLLCVALGGAAYWAVDHFFPRNKPVVGEVSDSREQLKAINERMVEMQARMIRLDALGEHLAESANINSEEFDFKKKPPMGGPITADMSVLNGRPQVMLRLQELSAEIDQKEAQLQALDSLMSGQRALPQSFLANMPLRSGYITSPYGYRTDPFTGRVKFHSGIDFAGAAGTHVFAVAAGIVTWAGEKSGYGNLVEINHGDGVSTRYAHASRVAVRVGDLVEKDQLVAYMGSTGHSTGPHLHYEVVRNGKQVDPATYIALAKR